MKTIQLTTRCKIKPGQYAAFEKAATACLQAVRAKDKGTRQYDWFVDAEKKEAIVRETYADSDAVLVHVQNLGDGLGALLATCDMSLEIHGSPTPALMDAAKPFPHKVYGFLQGL